jgi:uncharacterized protein (TIGR02996 family)
MSERVAFLRAIADQPADRTARLVFADFLEETGDAGEAVRAEFVRAQVEAETVHPNSNRRAELEARARELFSVHWLDWWAPVCDTVGLPPPDRGSGIRGWLTRRLGTATKPGRPYTARWPVAVGVTGPPSASGGALHRVEFDGGFPEVLTFTGRPGFAADFLRRWADVSPLAALDLRGVIGRDWRAIDGPHLSGLRALRLSHNSGAGFEAITGSPHLSRLEALRLDPDRSNAQWPAQQYRMFASSPLAGRVTRLSITLADATESLALHGAPLSKLTALEVRAPRGLSTREGFERATLAAADLLSLPHLDHVAELTLDRTTTAALVNLDRSLLGRLRKLELAIGPYVEPEAVFNLWALAPALTDLSILGPNWTSRWVAALAAASFGDQLRHLRLDGHVEPDRDRVLKMLQLVRGLDADRLETLRLGEAVCPSPKVRAALTEKFGDRVRFG